MITDLVGRGGGGEACCSEAADDSDTTLTSGGDEVTYAFPVLPDPTNCRQDTLHKQIS